MLSAIADALKVLDEELQTAMRLLGANTVDQLGTQNVGLAPTYHYEFQIRISSTIRSTRELWSNRYTTDQLVLRI